jgi:hypothetical protein
MRWEEGRKGGRGLRWEEGDKGSSGNESSKRERVRGRER